MSSSSPAPAIALWLLPQEPVASFCRQTIEGLARQYDAPVFNPHLTLGIVAELPEPFEHALTEPIELPLAGVFWSEAYTKSLFIRFEMTSGLRAFRQSLGLGGECDPHVSLLYQNLPTEEKAQLASSLKLPFSIAEFDRLTAVRCANPTRTRADVEAWQTVG